LPARVCERGEAGSSESAIFTKIGSSVVTAIANLIEFQPNEKPRSIVAVKEFSENQFVVMMSTDGLIKKTRLSEFRNVRRGALSPFLCGARVSFSRLAPRAARTTS